VTTPLPGFFLQELVPFALALKVMLHVTSMSLIAEARIRGSYITLWTPLDAIFLSHALTLK
jgi:hypothetical protein